MARLFIFGLGYTAGRVAESMEARGWRVDATGSAGNVDFADREAVRQGVMASDWVLSSVPPADGADPVIDTHGEALRDKDLAYLSSTGVYGDTGGAWVDETAPIGGGRRTARATCDARWLELGARVFRLPGIYGPGRSALDRVREGRAHRIAPCDRGPDQVFSRVHVDDIVAGVVAAIEGAALAGAYNLTDDLPTSQNAVIEEACRLLGIAPPPLQTMDEAGLSTMARGFYAENRRASNARAKRTLAWRPQYPTFREGLAAIRAAEVREEP